MEKPVLIATASFDEHAYSPVAEILEQRGYPVVIYRTDRLLSGEDSFTIDMAAEGGPSLQYNGVLIQEERISAAWYRKIGSFAFPDVEEQLAKQLHMNNEVRALHDTIWPVFYSDDIWLNSPSRISQADRKLSQLMVAEEVGFSVPRTYVGSDWEAIREGLVPGGEDEMIIKMMRGVTSEDNNVKTMHTTIVDQQKLDKLKTYTSPFPGLYQPFIDKAREWRVAAVGENIFPTAIYTTDEAKSDWRKLQETDAVQFRDEALPEGISELCIGYLEKMGLRFGAFDLVEKPSGEVVFLECNPNGQYGWQEEKTGFPISVAIADELVSIAHS